MAFSRGRDYLVYLEPKRALPSYFPSIMVLDLAAARYSVRTWDCGKGAYTGTELAAAPPLVCGPPCSGAALTIRITEL